MPIEDDLLDHRIDTACGCLAAEGTRMSAACARAGHSWVGPGAAPLPPRPIDVPVASDSGEAGSPTDQATPLWHFHDTSIS